MVIVFFNSVGEYAEIPLQSEAVEAIAQMLTKNSHLQELHLAGFHAIVP